MAVEAGVDILAVSEPSYGEPDFTGPLIDACEHWMVEAEKARDEVERLREVLEWIYAEPEYPEKVQARAKAALDAALSDLHASWRTTATCSTGCATATIPRHMHER